jgi:hypothetical protein
MISLADAHVTIITPFAEGIACTAEDTQQNVANFISNIVHNRPFGSQYGRDLDPIIRNNKVIPARVLKVVE